MADPSDFRRDLMRAADKIENVLREIPQEIAIDVRLRVALRTPILTGRASASWNASAGSPDLTVKPESYLNPGGTPTQGNVNVRGGQLGTTYWVSNAIHYLPRS